MEVKNKAYQQSIRIIWAIFSKDLIEAVKNKTTIGVLVSALFIVLMYRALPLLEMINEPPNLLVYDEGDSSVVRQLESNQSFNLYTYTSEEKLRTVIMEGEVPEIGLILPTDLDRKIALGEGVQLKTLVLNWISPDDRTRLETAVQQEMSQLTGQQVRMESEIVFMTPEAGGIGVMAGLGTIFTTVMIGLMLIPHLMLEEKKNRTMDALQVSPATAWELAAAKALVGLFYCLLAVAISLGIYSRLVLHWWLAILAMVCISLVIIPLGLWLGTRLEDRSQLTIFSWVFILPLFFPMIIMLLEPLFPAIVVQIAGWFPTSVALNMLRAAIAQPIDWIKALLWTGYLLVWIGLGILLVVWQIRRLDRPDEDLPKSWSERRQPGGRSLQQAAEPRTDHVNGTARKADSEAAQLPLKNWGSQTASSSTAWIRRILAITGKDLREALKNRMLLSLVIGTVLLILPNAILPTILRSEEQPSAVVYDPGESEIIYELSRTPGMRLQVVDSEAEFNQGITEVLREPLGLSIPQDFDELARHGRQIVIPAAAVHWADPDTAAKWAEFYASKLSEASGSIVQVQLSETGIYPSALAGGFPRLIGVILSLSILTLGLAVLPLLMVEEKEAHTFEALLVSPTNLGQIVTGKALAGMVFTLLVFSVASLIYAHLLNHWLVILLTALVSTFFITAVGLLIGILSDNPSTTSLWSGLGILSLLVLIGLEAIIRSTWPAWIQTILTWTPGAMMVRMLTTAMAKEFQLVPLLLNAAVLVGIGLLLYGLDALLIFRRQQI